MSGTSGNRTGYKIFSFNTSVRNPKRNEEFLSIFKPFSGKVFDDKASYKYLCELVKHGVYKFNDVPISIREKWENEEELTQDEIEDLINRNPQETGLHNRVMTSYMRCLKDQGFLVFYDDPNGSDYHIIELTKLGEDLINPDKDKSIVYTKALIGIHANSPIKPTFLNKSRPFLNTIFVINEVNNLWKDDNGIKSAKGILKHEFGVFVLSMKDCNYKKCAKEIIKYREKYRYEINEKYISEYLKKNKIQPYKINSIVNDYPDEVFRKFEMTGLITAHGAFSYVYYNISSYNKEKVNQILDFYKDYKFVKFSNQNEYNVFLYNIFIPWESDLSMRIKIAKTKAAYLGRPFNNNIPLEEEEEQLDRVFYSGALSKAIKKYDIKIIFKELLILGRLIKEESKFNDISEPLRLEYLLALVIGKLYGTEGLVSNIIYNEDGKPMHFALGNQCDIMLYRKDGSLILEPTMICNRDQQKRNETTSISRHAVDAKKKLDTELKVLMIAPKVHIDTIDYFTYRSEREKIEMVALTICKLVGLFGNNPKYSDMYKEISEIYRYYKINESDLDKCADEINAYKPDKSLYE